MTIPADFAGWPEAPYTTVTWRRAAVGPDGADENLNPDWSAMVGSSITLVPDVADMIVYDPYGEDPITITMMEVPCRIDSSGYLTTVDGMPIHLLASKDPLLSHQNWTWYVKEHPNVRFTTSADQVVDLSRYVLAPATDQTKSWVDRIPDLINLIPQLVGILDIRKEGNELVVSLSDETERRYPAEEIEWSDILNPPATYTPTLPLEDDSVLTEGGSAESVMVRDGRLLIDGVLNDSQLTFDNTSVIFRGNDVEGNTPFGAIAVDKWLRGNHLFNLPNLGEGPVVNTFATEKYVDDKVSETSITPVSTYYTGESSFFMQGNSSDGIQVNKIAGILTFDVKLTTRDLRYPVTLHEWYDLQTLDGAIHAPSLTSTPFGHAVYNPGTLGQDNEITGGILRVIEWQGVFRLQVCFPQNTVTLNPYVQLTAMGVVPARHL